MNGKQNSRKGTHNYWVNAIKYLNKSFDIIDNRQ
jgi:hypothetical protein